MQPAKLVNGRRFTHPFVRFQTRRWGTGSLSSSAFCVASRARGPALLTPFLVRMVGSAVLETISADGTG